MDNYKCLVDTGKELEWIDCPKYDWQEYRKAFPPTGKIPTIQLAMAVLEKIKMLAYNLE